MAFGIGKKTIRYLLKPSLLNAHFKRNKLLKRHKHKNLKLGLYVKITNSIVGQNVYLGNEVTLNDSAIGDFSYINARTSVNRTKIGKFCSIASEVSFGLGKHPTNLVSTHPAFYANNKSFRTFSDKTYFEEFEEIVIGNDVWVGNNSIVMGGITIGNGAIVAAGSIVTKNVKSYEIVGGVPAKHIKYRIDERLIKQIESTEWWNREEEWLQENFKLFLDINAFIKYMNNNE